MKINYNERIFGLDLIRALAISFVLMSHSIWVLPINNATIRQLFSLFGYLGVEVFFVLSGFLIGRILLRIYKRPDFKLKDFAHFLVRRWFRTLPNYYLILVINILTAIYLGAKLPDDLWQYFVFFQNLAWPMSTFFGESWSLSIEEFAYILGPILLYLTIILNKNKAKAKLFLGVTVSIIVVFTASRLFYNSYNEVSNMAFWNTNLKAVVIYRIDAVYYGVLAAYIYDKYDKVWFNFRYYGLIIGIFLIIGLNLMIPKLGWFIETSPLFWNVFYVSINSIALAFTLPYFNSKKSTPNLILKPITFISLISYAMYLIHFSIVVKIIELIKAKYGSEFSNLFYVFIYFGLTVVFAFIVYKFYENPMTKLRDRAEIKNYFK